jgi:hypothetical protein
MNEDRFRNAGVITVTVFILVFPVLLVIAAVQDFQTAANAFRRFHGRQSPREQELTKASWGAAILVHCAGIMWLAGSARIQRGIDALSTWPNDLDHGVPAIAFLLVVAWGLLWFTTGTRRALAFGQERDARLITRALAKIATGLAIAILLWGPPRAWPHVIPAMPLTWPVLALVVWLTVTGTTKFLLVARGRRSPRPAPPTPSKAPARDATLDEALQDMLGHGGRLTFLDDRDF